MNRLKVCMFIAGVSLAQGACKTSGAFSSRQIKGERAQADKTDPPPSTTTWTFATPTDKRFVGVGRKLPIPIIIDAEGETIFVNRDAVVSVNVTAVATITRGTDGMPILMGIAVGEGTIHIEYQGKVLNIPFAVTSLNLAGYTAVPSEISQRTSEKVPFKVLGTMSDGQAPLEVTSSGRILIEEANVADFDGNHVIGKSEGVTNLRFSLGSEELVVPIDVHPKPTVRNDPKTKTLQYADVASDTPAQVRYHFVLGDLRPDDRIALQITSYSADFIKISCSFGPRRAMTATPNWLEQDYYIDVTIPPVNVATLYDKQMQAITVTNANTSYTHALLHSFRVPVALGDSEDNIISAGAERIFNGTQGAKQSSATAVVTAVKCSG